MLPKSRINRRQFIKGISGAAVAAVGFPYVASLSGAVTPSDRITLGFIGVGMQGRGLLWAFLQQPSCRVVAVCDVDKQKLNRSLELVGENYGEKAGCAAYGDFREVLARADIDGVVIATPDHWHSVISIEACKAGKDVYCEKALALSMAISPFPAVTTAYMLRTFVSRALPSVGDVRTRGYGTSSGFKRTSPWFTRPM